MPTILVSPIDETARTQADAAPRLDRLADKTICLLDISKPGGSLFLDRTERLLKDRYGVGQTVRFTKPTFARPAPDALITRIAEARCDAVIEALAD
jgi:hypothetical protein